MKTRLPSRAAFTLVELLVVIAIIGILAAMLMPVLVKGKVATQKMKAKTEISQIVTAIEAYDTDYGRFPMTQAEQTYVGTNDFTTGYVQDPQANVTWPATTTMSGKPYSFGNNSNVVAILMDLQTFGNSVNTMNPNHVKNPKQVKYLAATMAPDNTLPGVGTDGIYRDPWGNPYVISMNSSYNEQGTSDLFYSQQSVSQDSGQTGYYGLFNPVDAGGNGNHFLFHGKVMVWSAGPDKQVENGSARAGKNKDNVLSWQ